MTYYPYSSAGRRWPSCDRGSWRQQTALGCTDEDGLQSPWPALAMRGGHPARSNVLVVVRSSSHDGWSTAALTTIAAMKN